MHVENAITFNILGHDTLVPIFLPRSLLEGPEEKFIHIAGTLF